MGYENREYIQMDKTYEEMNFAETKIVVVQL
jgi:hypothetical protein